MSGKYFPDADLIEMYNQVDCDICGERLDDEVAEMYDPKLPYDASRSVVVHGQCGIDHKLEMA